MSQAPVLKLQSPVKNSNWQLVQEGGCIKRTLKRTPWEDVVKKNADIKRKVFIQLIMSK